MALNLNLTITRTLTSARVSRFFIFNSFLWVVLLILAPVLCQADEPDLIIQMAKIQKDSAAQYFLGRRYLRGSGVSKSNSEAADWFLKAARQGHVKAQYEVGLLYKNGMGVTKDNQAAFENFLAAANKGHVSAMFELGNYYFFGLKGDPDIKQAMKWYRNSAAEDHGGAQYQLGKILKGGLGVKVNKKEGQKWLDKARTNGVDLTNIGKTSITITRSKKPTAASKAPKVRLTLLEKIKKEGIDTQFSMGMSYLYGKGKSRRPEIAAQWLREAARNDHAGAQFELGNMYRTGIGVQKSNGEAIKWFRKASSWGILKAQTMLSQILDKELVSFINDSHGEPNIKNPEIQYKVGMLYLRGNGFSKSPLKAATWIIRAARNDFPQAQYEAGKMYRDGIGFIKDLDKAKFWLEKATQSGVANASDALASISFSGVTENIGKSKDKSLSMLEELKDPAEQYATGMALLKGNKTTQDATLSIQWLTLAANKGHVNAQKQLADVYKRGVLVNRDLITAAIWLTMAADAGDADSQFTLGNLYKKGVGVEKSNSRAIKWYRVAARQGHKEARRKFGCKFC